MASPRVCCCVFVVVSTVAASARAEGTTTPDDADVAARLAWIERVLDREASGTELWRGGWLGFYGAAVLVEGALLAVSTTRVDRVNDGVTVGKAALGFGFTLVLPATAAPSARALRGKPAGTPAERIAKLRLAESMLRAIAAEERERRGWFGQIGGALVNAGGAWITWLAARGSGGVGWFGAASGVAVAQLQFFTQPTGAIRAWEAYQRAGAGGRLGEPPPVWRWSIAPTAGGMAVRGVF